MKEDAVGKELARLSQAQLDTTENLQALVATLGSLTSQVSRLADEAQRAIDEVGASSRVGVRKVPRQG